jgi:protease II
MAKSIRLIESGVRWHGLGEEFVYVYTFKSYREKKNKKRGRIKMKIGMTTQTSPQTRINQQLGASNSEKAILLHVYKTSNARLFEKLIHKKLKKKGRHIDKSESIGTEWFWVAENEITSYLHEINRKLPRASLYKRYSNNKLLYVEPRFIIGISAVSTYFVFNSPELIFPFFCLLISYRLLCRLGVI